MHHSNLTHRRGDHIKWRLVSYTVVILHIVCDCTCHGDPRHYLYFLHRQPRAPSFRRRVASRASWISAFCFPRGASIVSNTTLTLSSWLADGLLVCPFVMSRPFSRASSSGSSSLLCSLLGSSPSPVDDIAIGIVFNFQNTVPDLSPTPWSGIPYNTISLSLDILPTLTTTARLTLQARDTRTALGMVEIGGLCTAIVTMLIESCVFYAMSSLFVSGP